MLVGALGQGVGAVVRGQVQGVQVGHLTEIGK